MTERPAPTPAIASPRLDLVWLTPECLRLCLEGDIDAAGRSIGVALPGSWRDLHMQRLFAMRLRQMTDEPASRPWLLRAMVSRESREVVGYINFHGAPDAEGRAELGYTVLEGHRRRGYASEAALAMMGWARVEHGVQRFVVSISPRNAASLAMAAKLGFERVGTQMDDIDGEEWVFELRAD